MLGSEHEFSINDEDFNPLPISDEIIRKIRGRIANEAVIGNVIVGKELQKHVIELKPSKPFESLSEFEEMMQEGINELLSYIDGYRLLGLGMHPLLKLENAKVWDHGDRKTKPTTGFSTSDSTAGLTYRVFSLIYLIPVKKRLLSSTTS